MKLLLLTTRLFHTPGSGGELCTARLISQLLGLGHHLHVMGRGEAPAAKPGLRYTSLGPLVPALAEMPAHRRLGSLLAALWRRRAWTVHRVQSGGASRRVHRLLSGGALADVDLLVVDHLQAWAWLQGLTLPPCLLLMHNLEAAAYRPVDARAGAGRALHAWVLARESHRLSALESEALRCASAVACLSEEDAGTLRRHIAAAAAAPKAVSVLPGYAENGWAESGIARPATPGRGLRIGLIGTWSWAPNRRALEWVLHKVRPHLPAGCELVLAGAGLAGLPDWPGVRRLGRVADVQTFYAEVDVVALAALDGSGVQEKTIEALVSARPVVATSLALRGLHPLPGGVTMADEPRQFALACATAKCSPVPAAVMAWNLQRQQRYREVLAQLLDAALLAGPQPLQGQLSNARLSAAATPASP